MFVNHFEPKKRNRAKKNTWSKSLCYGIKTWLLSGNIWRRMWRFFWLGFTLLLLIIWFYAEFILFPQYFSDDDKTPSRLNFSEATVIYDRRALEDPENKNNYVIYRIRGDENRTVVPLSQISKNLINATIAIEDDRFYDHFGFDLPAIGKAVLAELGIGDARGGSTITQQLVKNTFLTSERTYTRKFKELLIALKLEALFEKDQILEMYLNKIPYGSNAHGIEAASQVFFNKSAKNLTVTESAILASLPAGPTRFSPYGQNKNLLMGFEENDEENSKSTWKKGRKDLVLDRMLTLNFIDQSQYKEALEEAKNLEFKKSTEAIQSPHLVFWIKEIIAEKYGEEAAEKGGLEIFTTINADMQEVAENIIAKKTAQYPERYNAHNAAMLSIENGTGKILAYVGNRDFFDEESDGQVDMIRSFRQPGSSFKPFIYAAAFAKGYAPGTILWDVSTDFGGNYRPENFSGEFIGPIRAREALNASLNIPALKMTYLAGLNGVIQTALAAGEIFKTDPKTHGLSLGIGSAEVKILNHIAAFQIFASDGSYIKPYIIEEIRNNQGEVMEKIEVEAYLEENKKHAIEPQVAALVRNILTDESSRPTVDEFSWNTYLQLGEVDNGAKTGTSNRAKCHTAENCELFPADDWIVGFSPYLTVGIWVGNTNGAVMNPGATGLAVVGPLWRDFGNQAHQIWKKNNFHVTKTYPQSILIEKTINVLNGKLATANTPESIKKTDFFAESFVPTAYDETKLLSFDKKTGKDISIFTPPRDRIYRYYMSPLHSQRPDKANWENPVQYWMADPENIFWHEKLESLNLTIGLPQEADLEENEEEDEKGDERKPPSRSTRNSPRISFFDRFASLRRNTQPKKDDNIYLQLESPINNQKAYLGGKMTIKGSIKSHKPVRSMEIFLDDRSVQTINNNNFSVSVAVPSYWKEDSEHVLSLVVEATDGARQTWNTTIIAEKDKKPPFISFQEPKGNQSLVIGRRFIMKLQVLDAESAVKSVELWLDDEVLIGKAKRSPFQFFYEIKGSPGRHKLIAKAVDIHGNEKITKIPIYFRQER